MHYPDRAEFKKLAQDFNLIPIYREIVADVDTPVSAFSKLGESENLFLLESVEGGERLGRYSFLGENPYLTIRCKEGQAVIKGEDFEERKEVFDPLDEVEKILDRYRPAKMPDFPPFYGGAVGYMGYDVIRYFEAIPRTAQDDLKLPEMIFIFTDTLLIFDHLKHKIRVIADARHPELFSRAGNPHTFAKDASTTGNKTLADTDLDKIYDEACSKIDIIIAKLRKPISLAPLGDSLGENDLGVESNLSKEDFLNKVERAKEYIRAGDVLQIVFSQRFSAPIKSSPFNIYRVLRTINPSPYMYYLKFNDLELIGSSPEPLIKVQGRKTITRPIAGTRPRGNTEEEDKKLEEDLLRDVKERAEHIMLVDLGRNDLGRVCKPGTVKVDNLMFIEKYSHVMHIVSNVEGELAEDKDSFDVLRAAFPAGTVSGAPKIRAMEIIDELEPTLRGPYAGIVGYFSYSGDLDSCITIRTIVIHNNRAYVQAGAGIVYDSVPEKEYQETVNKAKAMIRAIKVAEGI